MKFCRAIFPCRQLAATTRLQVFLNVLEVDAVDEDIFRAQHIVVPVRRGLNIRPAREEPFGESFLDSLLQRDVWNRHNLILDVAPIVHPSRAGRPFSLGASPAPGYLTNVLVAPVPAIVSRSELGLMTLAFVSTVSYGLFCIMTLSITKQARAVCGEWCRWNRYRLSHGRVIPDPKAKPLRFDPWRTYRANLSKYRTVEQPYLSLLELKRSLDQEFEATGVLCGIEAAPPPVAAANRAAFDERAAREGGEQPHYLSLHTEERWAWDLVTSKPIVNAASQLLGTDNVFCLATHAFCKLP